MLEKAFQSSYAPVLAMLAICNNKSNLVKDEKESLELFKRASNLGFAVGDYFL